jgi:2,3-diketo-5-methylthio-1-phosphopentane phosphatase
MTPQQESTPAAKVYLLDIEGTVAPLTLTTDVLFPYARAHVETFLKANLLDSERSNHDPAAMQEGTLRWDLMMLKVENLDEHDPHAPRLTSPGLDPLTTSMSPAKAIPRILAYIYWLMDHDRKSTALKSLQGKVWKSGFESGELKGTLFQDVPDAFTRWSSTAAVAIYSSGSVEAQKLLFRHSTYGDLTPRISAYFDTRSGPKVEPGSYATIAGAMNVAPEDLLFFSDAVRELDAARAAGCVTRLVIRPGNPPVANTHQHPAVESFAAL